VPIAESIVHEPEVTSSTRPSPAVKIPPPLVFVGKLGPVITLPLALLVIGIAVIPHEERGLTAAFGAEYTSYCARVRRWL
jgi:protein-S-isoprenylcysteine O-methyltransferase Ste14